MGRLGDGRFGDHMFGGGTEKGRVGRTRAKPFSAVSERIATYHRESVVFSSSYRVSTERALQMIRQPSVHVQPMLIDATRALTTRRESTSYAQQMMIREADAMIPNWRINGDQVKEFIDETRDWQQLELTFRAPEDVAANSLRPLDQSTGKYETVEMPDGSYKIIERAASGNEVTVEPPENRDDLRTVNEFVVDDYEEEMSDQDSTVYIVDLSLAGTGPKESTGDHGTVSADSTEYHFAFADGEVATRRVEREVSRGGISVEGARQLSVVLTEAETIVLEESLNRQGGVRIREVPDAPNIVEDTTADGRNTVTITPPSGESDPEIAADDYAVLEWETNLINDQRFQVSLTVVPLSG